MASSEDKLKSVGEASLKKDLPPFRVGDTVSVHVKIVEEDKARTQLFEGIIIAVKGPAASQAITVRKISFGEGVERVFPVQSPFVEKIVIKKKGTVKRAKLYYLRKKIGKDTKVNEQVEAATGTPGPADAVSREQGQKEKV